MASRRGLAVSLCLVLSACAGMPGGALQPAADGGGKDGPIKPDGSLPDIDPNSALIFDPCTSTPLPGYDPASHNLPSCCEVGPAHCVPRPEVHPGLTGQLRACEGGDYVCMPDPIITAGGSYRPATCTSSLLSSPGVCLSKCIPLVGDNPQTIFLKQDGCETGELCIPCLNPLDGTPTGACELIDLLCGPGMDGGTPDAGPTSCPHTGPPVLDPSTFAACAPACGGAHCLPASLVPAGQQTLLAACTAEGGAPGLCAPDVLIETAGNYVPPTCVSIGGSEGRCLSTCLPDIAQKSALLPRSTCGPDERCAPCYDPTSTDPSAPTGACNLACDAPTKPPLVLSCPYTGPALIDPRTLPACAPTCSGAHCVPGAIVPGDLKSLLNACPGGFCAPDSLIATGGNTPPPKCRSVAGAEGRCLSTCIPLVAEQSKFLPRDTCKVNEACVPCFDPTSANPTAPTGACSIASCDKPSEPPVALTCPWTGPPVIDPNVFDSCAPACGGAHCVPSDRIPDDLQSLLAPCPGGFCAPDKLVAAGGQLVPQSCRSIAGVEGRCMSLCLPPIADQIGLIPRDVCPAGELCAPCFDPTNGNAPTGACTIACDMPKEKPGDLQCPWTGPPIIEPSTFPQCEPACGGSRCVPASFIPEDQRSLLAPCTGGYCAPEELIATAGNFVPRSCTSVAGAEGRCLSTCLPPVAAQSNLLPRDVCSTNELCVPCYDPTSGNPTEPTGACSLGCDAPVRPPVQLSCPWTGPPVIDADLFPSCCNGAHCLPASFVPDGQRDLLAKCSVNGGTGYCTPDPIIETANNYLPPTCRSIAGVEGRCLSECLPPVKEQPLLPRSTCDFGQKCVPCYDPTSAKPTEPTGACSLGCDKPLEPPLEKLSCPWEGPPVILASSLPQCSPTCGGAHCLPAAYVPVDQRDILATCPGGYCTPDPLIETANNWVPETCTSIAGAEGRCLSTCLPVVAEQPLLPRGECGPDERCVPCYDPTSADPTKETGACSIASCDKPMKPPVEIDCPWDGPAVINPDLLAQCSPTCGGAHCLPSQYVTDDVKPLLETCTGGYCTPDDFIASAGEKPPMSCRSIAGVEGRCLSTCLKPVKEQPLLPQDRCDADERCVPCYDPTSPDWTKETGACSIASCDKPMEDPVQILCPWTGPPVIDPSKLPLCNDQCAGAHCLPTQYVPEGQQDLLAACTGGFCTPDELIKTAGQLDPTNCEAYAGTGIPGRCLSACIPQVKDFSDFLEAPAICGGEKCVPCAHPVTGQDMGSCGTISSCDQPAPDPPKVFPRCCSNTGTCIPKSLLTSGQEDSLAQRDCPNTTGSVYLCAPTDQVPGGGTPISCHVSVAVIPPFSWDGVCVPDCIIGDISVLVPRVNCPEDWSCAPP